MPTYPPPYQSQTPLNPMVDPFFHVTPFFTRFFHSVGPAMLADGVGGKGRTEPSSGVGAASVAPAIPPGRARASIASEVAAAHSQ